MVMLKVDALSILKPIRVFVDTGSPWTTISEKEVRFLRRSYRRLSKIREIGVGGIKVGAYKLHDPILIFKDDKDNTIQFSVKELLLMKAKRDADRRISLTIPNVLGVDFLLENNLALYFDPYNKISYLEEVET